MELWTVLIPLYLFGFSCTSSQSLTMTRVYLVSDCQAGLRANQDRVIFTGTVNATGVHESLFDSNISLTVGSASSGRVVKNLCSINIDSCQPHETTGCYCKLLYAGVYNVFFNLTATEDLIGRSVKMVWPRRDFKQGLTSNWLDVPKIYKAKSEVNLFQVNLENISLSNSCKVPTKNTLSYMQYCCFNAPSPCVSKIAFQGITMTGSPCAVGNFIIALDHVYKLSHSVCGQESSKTISCVSTSVTSSNSHGGEEEQNALTAYNGYRNAAIFLASIIAIGLIIATVHRLDASLLFSSGSRRRPETMSIMREDGMSSNPRLFRCC